MGLMVFFMVLGYWISGIEGMVVALIFAAGGNLFAWWWSDPMVLSGCGAEEMVRRRPPDLVGMAKRLVCRAKPPVSHVFITPIDQPNTFASGRSLAHSAVAVMTGIPRDPRPPAISAASSPAIRRPESGSRGRGGSAPAGRFPRRAEEADGGDGRAAA